MAKRQAPTGRSIWNAVREELVLNLYPLPFSTLAPSVYHVYLHPDDFAAIEGIVPMLVEQIRQALTDEVDQLNRSAANRVRSLVSRLLEREHLPPIAVPPGGWDVHVRRDPDEELAPGQLGIVSQLAVPAPVEYSGTPTTRIVRSVIGAAGRAATVTHVTPADRPATPGVDAAATPPPAAPPAGPAAFGRDTEGRTARDRARLTYRDQQGEHTFVMRKDSIAIGRGGSAVWVDVQVLTTSRVSREHVRLRMDGEGRFFVQDVSLWGTSVDGVAVPPALKGAEGVSHPGPEHPLPPRARIGLADAISIDFEAL